MSGAARSNEASAASQCLLNCVCPPRLDLRLRSVCERTTPVLKVAFERRSLFSAEAAALGVVFDGSANRGEIQTTGNMFYSHIHQTSEFGG